MLNEYMFIILPIFLLVICVSAVGTVSYCKSRSSKNIQTPVNNVTNPSNHVSSVSMDSTRPTTAIFIVPTTSQVMEMFMTQTNTDGANNNLTETAANNQYKPPPSYGTVIVDVPPSYEQAIEHLANGAR